MLTFGVTAVLILAVALASRSERLVIPAAGASVEGLTSVLSKEVGRQEVLLRFEDVAAEAGVSFRHFPAERSSLIAEDMGPGVAWGDFDDDGLVDLFLVNFARPVAPGSRIEGDAGRARLYRNLDGRHFEDVTERSGLHFASHGMGAAWGDFDNDDDLDLYVTAFGENALYENRGGGTFADVTQRSGAGDRRFSSGCSWADYDRDGHLDLYVCNYVDFVFRPGDAAVSDPHWAEQPYTLNPSAYDPSPNALFHNNGDGTFTEVAAAAGVSDPRGRSLSASWVDLDNDGWPDLYVANDVSENGVFRNRGDGTFEDIGASSLAADYRGAMGLAVADVDADLDQDLFITHWLAQENAFYINMLTEMSQKGAEPGKPWFLDAADEHGLGQIALDMVGWATGFCDFDNDGLLDLWTVNGHTFETVDGGKRVLIPQRPFVFWNRGAEDFLEVAALACPQVAKPIVGRGGAQADFDRDGRVDLTWMVHQGLAVLLRNTSETANHWLCVELRQSGGNTRAIGGRVYATCGGRTQMGEVGCSSSYLSQHELTLHFGLGSSARVDELRIVWPDGATETHVKVDADQVLRFVHDATYLVRPETKRGS